MNETDKGYFEHTVEVAPDDIDELGHVNNAVYLRYAEAVGRAHSEREGYTLEAFRAAGVIPIVRRHVITYYRPAGPGDCLLVSTRVTKMGGPRAERHNQVRLMSTSDLLADIVTEWVWTDPVTGRPKRVPPAIRAAFGWDG